MAIELPSLPGLGQAPPNPLMTPEGQAAQRAYAQALMTGHIGDRNGGTQFAPVKDVPFSWTQGVSNMVNALMGGNAAREANANDVAKLKANTGDTTSFEEGPESEGHEKKSGERSHREVDSGGGLDKELKAIASIESGGDYNSVGPATRSGDRAYGKYQVMGANVPQWTKEVLGRSMTPEEFRHNPEAQEAVARAKFAQGGNTPEDRASVWFTGRPYSQGAGRNDGYISGATYVDRFHKAMGQPSAAPASGGSAMGFAGTGSPLDSNPAVAATTAALRGDANPQVAENTQVAAGKGVAPVRPTVRPNGQALYVDPRLVRPQPQMTPLQIQSILSSPDFSPQDKAAFLQQYRNQQNQIIDVQVPGGHVKVDANNPLVQQPFPDLQKGTKKLGDMERQEYETVVPTPLGQPPGLQRTPAVTPQLPSAGPRSEATPSPAPAPSPAPQGTPAPAPNGGPTLAQNAPAAPAAAPTGTQVASLEPGAGAAKAAKQEAPKAGEYQRWNPTTGGLEKATDKIAANEPATPLAKFAQAGPPPGAGGPLSLGGFSPQDTEDYARMQEFKRHNAVEEEAQKKAVDFSAKKYTDFSNQVLAAGRQMPNLQTAQALMNDPNFYSGLFHNEVATWNKFKAALPSFFGDAAKAAAAPNEVFNKVISGSILDNMKTALGGLGQVRVAEIELLKQANASNANTPAANRALLALAIKSNQQLDHLGSMAQNYYTGGEVVDPVSGKVLLKENADRNGQIQPRHGLDANWDKLARKFMIDHPTMTPEEIKNVQEIFKTGIDPKDQAQMPQTNPTQTGQPAIGEEKQFKQGTGVWDGKQWVPKGK